MKRSLVGLLVSAALLVVASGCAATARRAPAVRSTPTVALAITVNGGEQPTPAQFLAIQKAIMPAIDAQGWAFVSDYTLATHIVRIDFTPSLTDPENGGRATILSVRPNPLSVMATVRSRSGYPASFTYASGFGHYGNFYGYDRYDRFYDSYYSYYTPVTRESTTPAPATMPTFTAGPEKRHRNDDYCPPGERRPPLFANVEPAAASRSSSWRNDSGYARSEPAYSRYEPSYSSSSSGSSYSGYSHSGSSYSSSSSSYSSSYSDSSSSVSSSSSFSSSAPTMSSYTASESVSSSSSFSGSGSSASTDSNQHQN